MRLLSRTRPDSLHDRLVWQCASLLLSYPDQDRLDIGEELLAHLDGDAADLLRHTAAALKAGDPMRLAADYVDTFDLRRRATMYLTYWTAGDTRNRGAAMLEFAAAYRAAGVEPPRAEAPDYLPVVLEFAATIDPVAGRRLLVEYRVSIDVLRLALIDADSRYAHAVTAVCQTLPAATTEVAQRAQRLTQTGPPAEAVGLQPFTLTVPPRRTEGGG
jgi:nitrate reductase delta subunit